MHYNKCSCDIVGWLVVDWLVGRVEWTLNPTIPIPILLVATANQNSLHIFIVNERAMELNLC